MPRLAPLATLGNVGIQLIQASERNPARVVVAGGGVAALEAVLVLRSLSKTHFEISIVSRDEQFHARPLSVGEPFGLVTRDPLDLSAFSSDNSARFHHDVVTSVDPDRRIVTTAAGPTLGYDALLLALGA